MNSAGKTIKLRTEFGGLIRHYRLKLKLSQEMLAEKAPQATASVATVVDEAVNASLEKRTRTVKTELAAKVLPEKAAAKAETQTKKENTKS